MGDNPQKISSVSVLPKSCSFFVICSLFHGATSPASKPAPAWVPHSMRPQVLPGVCSHMGFPWGHSCLWAFTSSSVGPSIGCRWGTLLQNGPPWAAAASPWSSPWAAGESFGATLPPPSILALVSAELPLLHILTPLFLAAVAQQLFPLS